MQYGLDFTFAHHGARTPVHWPGGRPIAVRLAGTPDRLATSAARALAQVLHELREATGYRLAEREPHDAAWDPAAVPDGEIHVCYAASAAIRSAATHCAAGAGLGGGAWDTGSGCYVAGFAVVNADLVEDAESGPALTILRHELGHAIGLGHAESGEEAMHYEIGSRSLRYGPGDRHGLTILGQVARACAADPGSLPRPTGVRTPPCAV